MEADASSNSRGWYLHREITCNQRDAPYDHSAGSRYSGHARSRGLALVHAEALACGCPVIGTTNTVAENLFTGVEEGFVVPIRDIGALVARVQALADDPDLERCMSVGALARVRRLGGRSTYAGRVTALMRSWWRAPRKLRCRRRSTSPKPSSWGVEHDHADR